MQETTQGFMKKHLIWECRPEVNLARGAAQRKIAKSKFCFKKNSVLKCDTPGYTRGVGRFKHD